jgi:phosphatidate cytidylyltransferase
MALKQRLGSGIALAITAILSVMFLPAIGWLIVVLAMVSLGTLEYYRLLDHARIPAFRVVGLLCGLALIIGTFFSLHLAPGIPGVSTRLGNAYGSIVFILFLTVIIILVRQFPQKYNDKPLETIACTLLGVFYVPLLFNFMLLLAFGWGDGHLMHPIGRTGQILILYVVVVTKITDIGAYFIGSAIGKNKLFPRLSPGKTWEGVGGGLLVATLASLVIFFINRGQLGDITMSLYDAIVLGLFLGVVGIVGDLAESLLKRASGSKDSGGLFPGMGGILDVIDSLLFTAPLLYIYVRIALV